MKYKNKYISIFIFIFFITFNYLFNLNIINGKNIFTFYEPKNKIPGFLSLCIKTWKKFLPEYKVIILDYNKTKYYLGNNLCSRISDVCSSDLKELSYIK